MFGRENKKGQPIKIPERVIPKNENPFAHIEEAEMKKINEKLDEVIAPFKEEEEKAKSNKGEYVQGGIKEYGGLPEEEIRQIDHILEENSKLEKRVIRIENALIHIEDDEYQEIIALRYFKNKSIEEIATHLDVNEKTIARNRTRIINKLQTILFSEIIIGY